MLGVALSLVSAVLFGGMAISLGFAVRRNPDAEAGAFVTVLTGFLVCSAVAAIGREWGGDLVPFLLAGLLAPGGSQLLFVIAVREAGPARASVIAGAAPLVAVTIAILAFGEPLALRGFVLDALATRGKHCRCRLARDDHDTIVVGHQDIARGDVLSRTHDRHIHRAHAGFCLRGGPGRQRNSRLRRKDHGRTPGPADFFICHQRAPGIDCVAPLKEFSLRAESNVQYGFRFQH